MEIHEIKIEAPFKEYAEVALSRADAIENILEQIIETKSSNARVLRNVWAKIEDAAKEQIPGYNTHEYVLEFNWSEGKFIATKRGDSERVER